MKNKFIRIFESINNVKINKNSTIFNKNDQDIVKDILSLNEDINTIKNKLISYGKRGALTLAILFAVANSVNANIASDIINTGIEYVNNIPKDDFYSACIGYLNLLGEKEKTSIERKQAIIECRIYFENLRDHKKINELSKQGKIVRDFVLEHIAKNQSSINDLINQGKNVHTSDTVKH